MTATSMPLYQITKKLQLLENNAFTVKFVIAMRVSNLEANFFSPGGKCNAVFTSYPLSILVARGMREMERWARGRRSNNQVHID